MCIKGDRCYNKDGDNMIANIKGVNVNYIQYGKGADVVLLHGWGQNIEMMQPLGKELVNHRVTILDFPGFGESEEPKTIWTIEDYSELLEILFEILKVKKPILIGHSFGGRVAIHYASLNPVHKLVLFGSPCIRHERKSIKESFLKSVKKLPGMDKLGEFSKKFIGSTDYKNASPIMRNILVQVINQDLTKYAKKIDCPTLLIWGTLDEAAPIEEARELEAILPDGALIELEGYTHYAYLEALPRVKAILKSFM